MYYNCYKEKFSIFGLNSRLLTDAAKVYFAHFRFNFLTVQAIWYKSTMKSNVFKAISNMFKLEQKINKK